MFKSRPRNHKRGKGESAALEPGKKDESGSIGGRKKNRARGYAEKVEM